MADMERILVAWTGVAGLPGVSVFYGTVGASANADIKTFFTAIAGLCPLGLSWTIPGSGDLVDDATGSLTGSWVNAGGGGTVAASGASQHAAGCGADCYRRKGQILLQRGFDKPRTAALR